MPGQPSPVNVQAENEDESAAREFERCDDCFRSRRHAGVYRARPHQRLERRAYQQRPHADFAAIRSAVGFGAREDRGSVAARKAPRETSTRCWPSSSSTTKATSALSRAFPGAVASLETLAAAGVKLAVYTNKHEYLSRKLLEALRLGTTSKASPGATLSQCQNRIPVISLR